MHEYNERRPFSIDHNKNISKHLYIKCRLRGEDDTAHPASITE